MIFSEWQPLEPCVWMSIMLDYFLYAYFFPANFIMLVADVLIWNIRHHNINKHHAGSRGGGGGGGGGYYVYECMMQLIYCVVTFKQIMLKRGW